MKRYIRTTFLMFAGLTLTGIVRAEETDTPEKIGDNLDLMAVLDAFKTAETIEDFEKKLNDPESKINNLDLNEDDAVDYIRVIDNYDGDAHAFTLRIDLDDEESQDVAVIELEKTGKDNAVIQVVGDEELYGEDYIIEPKEEMSAGQMPPALVVVNVWRWPSVRFVYGSRYKPWRSPWRWHHYPAWWKPWRPHRWGVYRGFHTNRYTRYHVVHVHRVGNAHKIYHKNRRTCKRIRTHKHHHKHYAGTSKNHGTKSVSTTKKGQNGVKKEVTTTKKTPQGQKQTKTQMRSNGNKTQKRQKTRRRKK